MRTFNELQQHSDLWCFRALKDRILNATQKDPLADLFGCSDRAYAGWKLKDFPDLSLQYGIYPFALMLGKSTVSAYDRVLLSGMVRFWMRGLRHDGSADQCFPGEGSIGPTLYSAHGILSCYDILAGALDQSELIELNQALIRALNFSLSHPENYGTIANHKALFAHAYLLGYERLKRPEYLRAYEKEVQEILACYQSEEGWFLEYETADPGYQTQCLHYLTLCARDRADERLKKVILDSIEKFVAYFVFPDGSFAGKFGGRANELVYPYPFFYWSNESPHARQISTFLFFEKLGKMLPKWHALDFENCIRLGTNYLLSVQEFPSFQPAEQTDLLPFRRQFSRSWTEAGLHVQSDSVFYITTSLVRGGIFKAVLKDGNDSIEDTGFVLRAKGKKYVSSRVFVTQQPPTAGNGKWQLRLPFLQWSEEFLDPKKTVLLRILAATLLRFSWFADFIKKQMVKRLMQAKVPSPFALQRKVEASPVGLQIEDWIETSGSESLSLSLTTHSIPFHMASAGYFSSVSAGNENYQILDMSFKGSLHIVTHIQKDGSQIAVTRTFKEGVGPTSS